MGIIDTFSKRMKRREQEDQPDVYQYIHLPETFRVQVIHIWDTALGKHQPDWEFIHNHLAREYGLFHLGSTYQSPYVQCREFVLKAETYRALDIIELTFKMIDRVVRTGTYRDTEHRGTTQEPDDAISELNHRFREHGIGFQYEGGQIVRIDSQFLHSDAVVPAFSLLHHEGFRGASDEFLKAHEHYRHGRHKEANVEALKAFESTMKTICDARKWQYASNATAKSLIGILFEKELIPAELASELGGLRAILEGGVPTIRNKTSGHGQGAETVQVPPHLVSFALHLTAANIVFLVESHKAKK